MRVIFMGTPEFAVPSLERICESEHEIVAVVTAPDKRQGRGQIVRSSNVKRAAQSLGIERILQPNSVKDRTFAKEINELDADVIVVVAFRILPPAVFNAAKLGCFNLHGSLLPRYRGAAPIHHAVLNGDLETGVTTFFLQEKVDTGNVILRRSMSIGKDDTTGDVYERMMHLGAAAVMETLQLIEQGSVAVETQDSSLATPAPKVHSSDAEIDWHNDSGMVHNSIRGYSPVPGAWTTFRGNRVKLFRSRLSSQLERTVAPRTVFVTDGRLYVGCDSGCVELLEVQVEGKKRASAADFVRGYHVKSGEQFDARSSRSSR